MTLAEELLDTARRLARLDPTRPRQAPLRRAVSTAYYALFHRLVDDAAGLYTGDAAVRGAVGRTLDHGDMRRVSVAFRQSALPRALERQAGTVFAAPEFAALKQVASVFIELQESRHAADYDPVNRLTRSDALRCVDQAERAFAAWNDIRRSDSARLYLGCLLLWDRWNKPPR